MQESAGREPSLSLPRYTEKQKQKRTRRKARQTTSRLATPGATHRLTTVSPIHNFSMGRKDTASSPERRCSSRTFRYGYLVTT